MDIIFLVISGFSFLVGIFMAFKTIDKMRNNVPWKRSGIISSLFLSIALMLSVVSILLVL